MSLGYFVYKLIPPRPTFDVDATEEESEIMDRRVAYSQGLMAQGNVLIFGPVCASSGAWGLGVVVAESVQEVHEIGAADPAITSGMCAYGVSTMPVAVVPA
jgi:uncharacterized protein